MRQLLTPTQWTLLSPANLDTAWPLCAPWLIQAIGPTDEWNQIENIRDEVTRGVAQLWAVQDSRTTEILAVFVTEVHSVGTVKTLVIRWAGGRELDSWLEDLGVIERWAQRNDFAAVEIWGRPGWSKVFAPHGYRENFRVISKKIGKELH